MDSSVPPTTSGEAASPRGFIDIHCHLLDGLDDGPRTIEVSAHMCQLAHASGTVAVVATPHANQRFPFDPARTAQHCARLQPLAGALRLFTGCEMELSLENLPAALSTPAAFTLNRSRYLLLELMPSGLPPHLERVFGQLRDCGLTPILAHPERHPYVQLHPERLRAWIQQGCLVQLTGDSLTGRMGRRAQAAAWYLVRCGLAHFVASDAHDPLHRAPALRNPYRLVCGALSPEMADPLFIDNPRAVVENRPLDALS